MIKAMKKLTLALFLTLPLMAQPPLKVAPEVKPLPEMTNLSVDETDKLTLAFFTYYEARIAVLDALAQSKAGNTELQRVQNAEKSLQELLGALKKAHNAEVPCIWDYPSKKWSCPAQK